MQVYGYAMREPNAPLDRIEWDASIESDDAVIVRVAGCGVCHTDLSFHTGEVAPRHELPLVLGHEISGTVVEAGEDHGDLVGRSVLVPAVMPCGTCDRCAAGIPNTCTAQVMPGNDVHGGFASHVVVPGRFLVPLPETIDAERLPDFSVIADAVTTPYQAMERAGVGAGDVVVVIGVGGIGTHAVQIAAARGATVVAADIDDGKLAAIADFGAARTLDVTGLSPRDGKGALRAIAREEGLPDFGWKIFEMSGTPAGQQLAFAALPPGGTLGVVGFTPQKIEIRLSNLMALDARCFGNWGCEPALYADALRLVLEGAVRVEPFVERHPLSEIDGVFESARRHELNRRAVLIPEGRNG